MNPIQIRQWGRTQMPRHLEKPDKAAKAVLYCLIDHSDREGYCYPGQETISRETGWGTASIGPAIARLEAGGYITRSPRWRKFGTRTSDEYWLNLDHGPDELERGIVQPEHLRALPKAAEAPQGRPQVLAMAKGLDGRGQAVQEPSAQCSAVMRGNR